VATGFLPIEDQGYVLVTVQLPDGASLVRTKRVLDQVSEIAGKNPAVANVIAISGVSALDNNSTLANAGVAYVVLKDWSERGKGEDLRSLFQQFNRDFAVIEQARIVVFPPPPIQGIGNAAGFAMQLELRDGSFDLTKLQTTTNTVVKDAQTQSGLQRVTSSFRSTVPQLKVEVDRAKAETLQVSIDDVFATLGAYLGRATSTSSTNSAASSRSMCRRIRSSVCGRRTSSNFRCATSRAPSSRLARWCTSPRSSARPCSASTTSIRLRR